MTIQPTRLTLHPDISLANAETQTMPLTDPLFGIITLIKASEIAPVTD